MAENLLGAFLRTRRERVVPREVGLPDGIRRRTPGLRRAELATLAGVSIDYLTRLEQGRDRRPSMQVLGALADALRLSVPERNHLLHLSKQAGDAANGGLCLALQSPTWVVRPSVRALLDRLEPHPAMVVNRLADVLAVTTGYRRLVGPIGLLSATTPGDRPSGGPGGGPEDGPSAGPDQSPQIPPNLVRYLFTDPRARVAFPDWERVADTWVSQLRPSLWRDDPHLAILVGELTVTAGAPFSRRVTDPGLLYTPTGVERLVHPEVGALTLAYESLVVAGTHDQRLVVHLPADASTAAALDRLTNSDLVTV